MLGAWVIALVEYAVGPHDRGAEKKPEIFLIG
jgi:hypothetical protein